MNRTTDKPQPTVDRPTFGFNPRPRRRTRLVCSDTRSNEELVAEFLKTNTVKMCEPVVAVGAIHSSGNYEF